MPIVEQRIRNRIIEWLEMICEYDSSPPPWSMNETVNQFYDWAPDCPSLFLKYEAPYTDNEIAALHATAQDLERFCQATPATIKDEVAAAQTPEWKALRSSALRALDEFNIRGKLPEES